MLMEASFLDLRRRMSEVLRALDRNETVKILYRGRQRAILVPVGGGGHKGRSVRQHAVFGMWKRRQDLRDVRRYVRGLRKNRLDAV